MQALKSSAATTTLKAHHTCLVLTSFVAHHTRSHTEEIVFKSYHVPRGEESEINTSRIDSSPPAASHAPWLSLCSPRRPYRFQPFRDTSPPCLLSCPSRCSLSRRTQSPGLSSQDPPQVLQKKIRVKVHVWCWGEGRGWSVRRECKKSAILHAYCGGRR